MKIIEWYPGAFEQAGIPAGTTEVEMDRNEIYDLSLKADVMLSNGVIYLDIKGGRFRVR